jgi:hypothetical protein
MTQETIAPIAFVLCCPKCGGPVQQDYCSFWCDPCRQLWPMRDGWKTYTTAHAEGGRSMRPNPIYEAVSPEVAKCRDEQVRAATLLLAGHPEQHGLRMAVTDWFSEEVLILAGNSAQIVENERDLCETGYVRSDIASIATDGAVSPQGGLHAQS